MDGFLLSRADRTVQTTGTRRLYSDVTSASRALRRNEAELIAGALPFDPERPVALAQPEEIVVTDGPWKPPEDLPDLPPVRVAAQIPLPRVHVARVRSLVERLELDEFDKVVAARRVALEADDPIDPLALAARMIDRHPDAATYALDLSAAGERFWGHTLVGASPELLVSVRGDTVTCRPLAGTAARDDDPVADEWAGEQLLASAKNLAEHAFVTSWIRARLAPLCSDLDIPATPELTSTPDVWHLATPITGTLRDPHTDALTVAAALHPTPAVAGTPTEAALATIRAVEGDRRFYGGAVGWCDAGGDGDWLVAIRCAELSSDGLRAVAWAGGGIVAGSDPHAELDETTAKLRTLLGTLGL
ncbi:isochorismate synthase [Rhodococcus chondri]|uniref:isochorismate synthase n=1 Tax=Rhodococcus chondri TaxID=3065941 RepID=A0ABU7JZ02_9NOCA|nr:isochorismate synthase [Rhodococcus sp. CC-R104]MEE2035226.1 isochorismate synthase [Rhodococcus sp. CC-R104]